MHIVQWCIIIDEAVFQACKLEGRRWIKGFFANPAQQSVVMQEIDDFALQRGHYRECMNMNIMVIMAIVNTIVMILMR